MEPKLYFLCDIDGTIADLSHRLHFIEQKPADWDGFFADCEDDEPIWNVIRTVRALAGDGNEIIMVSGRSDAIREKTVKWLARYGVPFDALYMRTAGDHRSDDIVKGELLDQLMKDRGWEVLDHITGAFEDRDQVVKMYRDRGIRVFQVAYGNF